MRIIRYMIAVLVLALTPMSLLTATEAKHEQAASQKSTQSKPTLPRSGMTGEQVLKRFGKPEKTSDTVGHPPITIWYFKEFSVYFEYDRVIHSIAKS